MAANSDKMLAVALRRLEQLQLTECFDSRDLKSRPTETQQEIIEDINNVDHRYVLGGNQSGKSQLGARETAWIFAENHPYWERPEDWSDEPLLLIVMGRTTKQIEETIWRKIESLLEPGTYKVSRAGGVIQKVTNTSNGNVILFLSHHSENEAREKVQSFVAHYVWLDEMPGSYKLVEELHRRAQARRGKFLATFTPKIINTEIRRLVDASAEPYSKKYKLKAFDNPTYSAEDKNRILASLLTASDSYRQTVLEGDWMVGEEQVYYFDYEKHVAAPENYHQSWRHAVSVDPALKSKCGFTVWAEDPNTSVWYCVRADYISGILIPELLVKEIAKRVAGINIIRNIADTHESWFFGSASHLGIKPTYLGPIEKASRKGEFIKNLQQQLGDRVMIAPWCDDLISEFQECRWSERSENKIVNSSSFHLLDCAQYFVDLMPPANSITKNQTWHDQLWHANAQRKKAEAEAKKRPKFAKKYRLGRSSSPWK